MSDERPNLFDYATKELSQDAMIRWLIQWADARYAGVDDQLHRCGRHFVTALLRRHDASVPEQMCVCLYQQDKGIDVLARVGPNHVLLIEDKTDTSDHSGQLERYYDHVVKDETSLKGVAQADLYPIYLKTGNQSLWQDREIEGKALGHRPYKVFNRKEFLDVLCAYRGDHHALHDFRDYLERLQSETEAWRERKPSDWPWSSWQGFYRHLEKELCAEGSDEFGWGYVPNPSGGFLAFWWNFEYPYPNDEHRSHVYLQLEVDPRNPDRQLLCFKVGNAPKDRQQELKWSWHCRICKVGNGKVEKPPVMRAGWTMTVARWTGDWMALRGGRMDLAGTVANLRTAERILKDAVSLGAEGGSVPES